MNRPTPDPSQEGSRHPSAPREFLSREGLGVGSWSQCLRKSERRTSGEWVRRAIVRLTLFAASGWLFTLSSRAADLTVFAAASLSDALKEIAVSYKRQSADRIVFNFGSSSMLARQIQEGAPADVFFSADESRMDGLEKAGLILKETRRSRLSNSLAIVVAADSPVQVRSAEDLADARVKRIALADPRTVPAGVYARDYLEQAKIWPAVQRKIVPTENVRAALAAVESGNVDAGIVYKTDAAISGKVKVAYAVRAEEGPEIRYPMAVVKESARTDAAKKFVRYLDSVEAEKVFEKYGFIVRK